LVWEVVFGPTGFIVRFVRQAILHAEYKLFAQYGDYAKNVFKDLQEGKKIWGTHTDKQW
jgi:hypothetical protein